MKKIIVLLIAFIILPYSVQANENFDSVIFSSAFDQTLDIEKIGNIVIEIEIIPNDSSNSPFKFSIILNKENNYKQEINNRLPNGKLNILYVLVGDDYASIKYNTKSAIAQMDEDNARVQIVVSPKNINTSSTADKTVLENIMKEHFLDDETKDALDYISTTTTMTTTTTQENGTIVIGQDKTTSTTVNETTQSRQEQLEKEKKENQQKEDIILKVMIYVILGVLLVAGIFVGIKIYNASKLN